MRDLVDLRHFWHAHRGKKLALCTLVRKEHFGYRAIGARKIIAFDGETCGLLSGGCLEGDINRVARENWDSLPFIESFSTMGDTDRLFGYQTGCPGIITILFQAIPDDADVNLFLPFGDSPKAGGVAVTLSGPLMGQRVFADNDPAEPGIFFDPWVQPVSLYVIGCGADAPVFAELATPMGWNIRFLDYNGRATLPASIAPYNAEAFPLDAIGDQIVESPRTAVVLMTHNYEADVAIFKQLTGKKLGYIGCLGPRRRYDELKRDVLKTHAVDSEWEKIVHAPAGLFTSGRAPEEIALSVIAQIQSLLRTSDRV